MTTAIESQYQCTAEVKSKGKQQNREAWTMVVDWRLPGSKYDLTLYGTNWETVEGHDVGELVTITIQQGNLKTNKDGQYSSDFFWDMVSIEPGAMVMVAEEVQATSESKSTSTQVSKSTEGKGSEPPPNPAALGACHNHAVDFIVAGILPLPEGREGWRTFDAGQ